MMRTTLLFSVIIGLVSVAVAETPCANVWVYNGTVGRQSPADLVIKNSIEERIKSWSGLCFRGYVKSGPEWQVQPHEKNEMLLSYTVGTMDDSNGVGAVGKNIEVVTFDVYSWDSNLKHIVNSGPDIAWFAASRDTLRLQTWANSAANNVVYVVALMSHDGREGK